MAGNSYKLFEKFYNENKTKLHMEKDVNYPLNYRKANHWAKSQCDNASRDFATNIIKFTRYVPYSTFIKQLKKICISYKESYSKKKDKDTKFILIIPFKIGKSNMWASLLAFEFLRDIIDDIFYDITDVYNKTISHRSKLFKKKVH
jgi:hypothetical protein